MPRKQSVFVTSEATISTLQVKVPASIKERIETLRQRISKIDPNLTFDANTICVKALERSLDNGESELNDLQSGQVNKGSPEVDRRSLNESSL